MEKNGKQKELKGMCKECNSMVFDKEGCFCGKAVIDDTLDNTYIAGPVNMKEEQKGLLNKIQTKENNNEDD